MPGLCLAQRAGLAFAALFAATACGGGMPLLHPAHVLRPGQLSGSVGASGNFVLGDADDAISQTDATGAGNGLGAGMADQTATGVAASVVGAPGVAPHVAARVGVAEHAEAGLTYSGRSIRIDGRYALEDRTRALSGGLGLRALLSHPTTDPGDGPASSGALSGVDASGVSGFAADVPVLVGYRSDAELVQAWAGLRATYEHIDGEVLFASAPVEPLAAELSADKVTGEALVGLAVGLQPIWVAVELSAGYFHIEGELRPSGLGAGTGSVDGVAVTPGGAIMGRF